MKHYPHTSPRSTLFGLAAAAATAATIAVAIVLPASVSVQPNSRGAPVQANGAEPKRVVLDRIEVVASRAASVHKAASEAQAKARG
jgi:hypothetical protein